MRTLAKRKNSQGYVLLILGGFCYCIMLIAPITAFHNFSIFKSSTLVALFLVAVFSLIGFCITFTKSIYLFADASLLSRGANLIVCQNNGIVLSSTEEIIVFQANRIFFKNQTNSH